MAELIELSSSKHSKLKVVDNSFVRFATKQHAVNIRVVEVAKAVSSFPVFFSANSHTGNWALSAMTSIEQGYNLFIENDQWTATYLPTCLQTYPLYLMRSPKDEKSYTIGIDEQSEVFTDKQGEQLFDSKGKASLYLHKITAILEADIKNDIQTYQFAQNLEKLQLLKPMDLLIYYQSGSIQTLKGLYTLDEDKLQSLSAEQLDELNKKGYLAPIHAILISLFQLNLLVKKHNLVEHFNKVKQIKLEVARDMSAV